MGCSTSDRKDASQQHREKMLVEYLRGIEPTPIKEVKAFPERNGRITEIPSHLLPGDRFDAGDGNHFELISNDFNQQMFLCLKCNIEIKEKDIKEHVFSSLHLNSL